jgi:pimeloyl-ACP methyl ester carboxylesterase
MNNTTHAIKPFTINIPQADLDDLGQRLQRARFATEVPGAGDLYGVTTSQVRELVGYWRDGFNWRNVEASLNRYPQFTTEIDGQTIHFVHVRSKSPSATPVILIHGWPSSFVEYIGVLDRLVNPEAHGGKAEDAFHVVIPSVPGFAFSGPPREQGWGSARAARAFSELMSRLGYQRYIAAGNDMGSLIAPEMGRADPQHVQGVHVLQVFSFPSGDPAEFAKLTPEEMEKLKVLQWFNDTMSGFQKLQSTKPQNIAHALADSPVGQLGWSLTLFGNAVSRDFILTNVALYWLTNTGGSAGRFYFDDAHGTPSPEPTTFPLGLANFATDFQSIRTFAERDHKKIVSWNTYDSGGHFATEMTPELYIQDLRQFARVIRRIG